ncbi:hypothetical protein VPJG_00062 [Vibrio phage jenny 12G5]|nr:hypothetical protein VPJG_00062 [Vibrio phage jenny 12G5]
MNKPYIETYENENGDIVLLYIGSARFGENAEVETILFKREHASELAKAIKSEA